MRILFLSTWFPYPPDNGSKLRVYHLLRGLSQAHEVCLASFAFNPVLADAPAELRQICQEIVIVPINPYKVNQVSTLARFLARRPVVIRPVPAMSEAVEKLLHQYSFDVVIASTEVMAVYALSAPSATVKILEEHNSLTRWLREHHCAQRSPVAKLRAWASWQKARYYEGATFAKFDLVTMVSEMDREVSETALPGFRGRVEVVPNGTDCRHNQPGLAKARPGALVYNGALTYGANYDAMRYFLNQIYPVVRRSISSVSLTITGSTEGVDRSGLRLDDSVHLAGYVEDVRLPVAEASVCVVPIRQGGGTRLKILESMALGTPVVATSKGAEGLAVVNGQHLVIADSADDFAHAVVRLLNNEGERQQLAAHARQLVEQRYDWQAISSQFTSLLEERALERKNP